MGKVTVYSETAKFPLQLIGRTAGVCWESNINDKGINIKRAKDCINSGHGRVLEWVEIHLLIDGYSARVMREFERHHIGASFLQQSTRYCEWEEGAAIVLPQSVKKAINENESEYSKWCKGFIDWIDFLKEKGVPKEDIAMFYPLGMETKIVDKRNLRSLVEMSHKRMCMRAYWEYRQLMDDIASELRKISDEWEWICDNLLVPQCKKLGYCPESKGCGRYKKRGE